MSKHLGHPGHEADVLERLRAWSWAALVGESSPATPGGALILGWNALENGELAAARTHLEHAATEPAFKGWALAGLATAAMRSKEFSRAHELLDALDSLAPERTGDTVLAALAAHIRGSARHHEGALEPALAQFERALWLAPRDHVLRGRILDSLGMHYAGVNNFTAARECFNASLHHKEAARDLAGIAFAHGSLGRLLLDWGYPDEAREHFARDLDLVRGRDRLAEAQMHNFLGRCDLLAGRAAAAAREFDECSARAAQAGLTWIEGFAHKDRALAHLACGELGAAAAEIEKADVLLDFPEGQAHVDRTRAVLLRAQGRHADAERFLSAAFKHFEDANEPSEAALTRLELARTLRARNAPPGELRPALKDALFRAEACRRTRLVRDAEAELRAADPQEFVRHAYLRARGVTLDEDAVNLFEGTLETLSVMFMDLKNSTEFVTSHEPQWVLMALNQIFAELAVVLRHHGAAVNQYLGDGFMAYFRGPDHARRGVQAALELSAVIHELNRPRVLLGLPIFEARMGVASGPVVLGYVGTFSKFDFTAIGGTTNLAARLQSKATPGYPCIAQATYDAVRELFNVRSPEGRPAELKGFGTLRVYDVTEVRRAQSSVLSPESSGVETESEGNGT